MKRRLIFIAVVMLMAVFMAASVCQAAPTWKTPDQSTVVWTAPTTLDTGDPIPADNTVEYDVFLSPYPIIGDRNDNSLHSLFATTANTTTTLTFDFEGWWVFGVQSIRFSSTGAEISRSGTISWSDDPTVCAGGIAFGWNFYINISPAVGLGVQ